MCTIRLDEPTNAPCCPAEIVNVQTGASVLVQTDWDYPSVAQAFGWSLASVQRDSRKANPCDHSATDGTITCPDCGMGAGAFIAAACDYITDNYGATAVDPGYFTAD